MSQDGKIPTVSVIKSRPDEIEEIEDRDMAEDDTPEAEGGGDPAKADVDQMLKATGQAPNLEANQMDTEPVTSPVDHLDQEESES